MESKARSARHHALCIFHRERTAEYPEYAEEDGKEVMTGSSIHPPGTTNHGGLIPLRQKHFGGQGAEGNIEQEVAEGSR